ncbi:hypothetical protein C5472_14120 [Photorhabdus sp. RW14-46]|nr:hypothetical protein [Photorhabdus sp. RW14-46]
MNAKLAGCLYRLTAYLNRAILFAILNLGSAQNPHVLRVRSGFSALSVFKLPATITPIEIGSKSPRVIHIPTAFILTEA